MIHSATGQPAFSALSELDPRQLWFALDSLPVPMLLFARGNLEFLAANQAALGVFGEAEIAAAGKNATTAGLLKLLEAWRADPAMQDSDRLQRLAGHDTILGPCGEPFQVMVQAPLGESNLLLVTLRRHEPQCARCEASQRDPVTELPTRLLWENWMLEAESRSAEHGERFGVVLMDLDDFKRINDTWGHQAGDAVLRVVGRRLRRIAENGRRVARFGGDEFAVLLAPLTSEEELATTIEQLRERLTEPVSLGGVSIPLSGSLGAAAGSPGTTVAQVLQAADRAMYEQKRQRQ